MVLFPCMCVWSKDQFIDLDDFILYRERETSYKAYYNGHKALSKQSFLASLHLAVTSYSYISLKMYNESFCALHCPYIFSKNFKLVFGITHKAFLSLAMSLWFYRKMYKVGIKMVHIAHLEILTIGLLFSSRHPYSCSFSYNTVCAYFLVILLGRRWLGKKRVLEKMCKSSGRSRAKKTFLCK